MTPGWIQEGLGPIQALDGGTNINPHHRRIEFGSPDLEFAWVDDREQDPLQASQIRQGDQAQQQAMSDAAAARLGHNGGPQNDNEHGGGSDHDAKSEEDGTPSNATKEPASAKKLGKGVKKKPNPYLPTTGHKQRSHELA